MWTPLRRAAKRIVFGPSFPQQCPLAIREPQAEVLAELVGLGEPRDVTLAHSVASVAPASIALDAGANPQDAGAKASLLLRENGPSRRLLGRLDLVVSKSLPCGDAAVCCLQVTGATSYCLPGLRLQAHYLHWAYLRRRAPPAVTVSALDARALAVCFTLPRPVVLVSVGSSEQGNLFPMNLMGRLGDDRFGFALNSSRPAAQGVKRHMRVAVCSVAFEHAEAVRSLGPQHLRETIDWRRLPFATDRSAAFGLPIPEFAQRVLDLEVLTAENMGSHTLFLARIVKEEIRADAPSFHVVHGFYQAWRSAHEVSSVR